MSKLNDESIDRALEHITLMDAARDVVAQYNTTADEEVKYKERLAALAGYLLQLEYIREKERKHID